MSHSSVPQGRKEDENSDDNTRLEKKLDALSVDVKNVKNRIKFSTRLYELSSLDRQVLSLRKELRLLKNKVYFYAKKYQDESAEASTSFAKFKASYEMKEKFHMLRMMKLFEQVEELAEKIAELENSRVEEKSNSTSPNSCPYQHNEFQFFAQCVVYYIIAGCFSSLDRSDGLTYPKLFVIICIALYKFYRFTDESLFPFIDKLDKKLESSPLIKIVSSFL